MKAIRIGKAVVVGGTKYIFDTENDAKDFAECVEGGTAVDTCKVTHRCIKTRPLRNTPPALVRTAKTKKLKR